MRRIDGALPHRVKIFALVYLAPIGAGMQVFFKIKSSQMRVALPFPSINGWATFISTYFLTIFSMVSSGIFLMRARFSLRYIAGAKANPPFAMFILRNFTCKVIESAENIGMNLLQTLYSTHFNVVYQPAFKEFVRLLLALFVDGSAHPLQPLIEHERLFARDDSKDGVHPLFIHDVGQILFAVFCRQFELSTNCRQLRIAAFDRIPIGTGVFALCESLGDVGSAKPPFGSLLLPNGTHGNIFKKTDRCFYHRSATALPRNWILILYHIPVLEASLHNDVNKKVKPFPACPFFQT